VTEELERHFDFRTKGRMREWRAGIEVGLIGLAVLAVKQLDWPGEWLFPAVYLAVWLPVDSKRQRLTIKRILLHLGVALVLGISFVYAPKLLRR
jgi:hypothetical protein